MANAQPNTKRDQFADLLRELFQLNQPELDFGIYRIMHARKDDINRFIEKDLPRIVGEAFKDFQSQDKVALLAELEKASKAAADAGFDPEQSPRVKELKEQLNGALNLGREEGEVYDALITFFNRYYDEGDFISRRVYKDGTYAIPYNGEEVVLHWANKDQYYIKSSETLRDFSFRLDPDNEKNPMRVHFRLVDAEAGAQNNNKESAESKRVFVLDATQPWEEVDGEQGKELTLRFHYRAATPADWTADAKKGATAAAAKKPPTQDHLRKIAVDRLLGDESDLPASWKQRLAHPYTKANGEQADYPILQGQLDKYTKSNTFDYFIHKDLGGFLTRELDFYIKNELLRWEDVAVLKSQPARLAPLLSKIEVIRTIGEKIIAFLAQLEEFQKKLWLKKKFVTEVNYCITLDRLEGHEELLEQVFDNEEQLKQWKDMYALDLKKLDKDYDKLSWEDFLAKPEYRYLMVDTGQFNDDFKGRLLTEVEDLDKQCNGLLINSENFQALNLLQERYQEKVNCVYIDPPYNTSENAFLYKNSYKHSSWLSMMANGLSLSPALMPKSGVLMGAIDDTEYSNLKTLLSHSFGDENYLGTIAVEVNPAGQNIRPNVPARSHDYFHIFAKDVEAVSMILRGLTPEERKQYKEKDSKGHFYWDNLRRRGGNSRPTDRPKQWFPLFFRGETVRVPDMEWDESTKKWIIKETPKIDETEMWPVDPKGEERIWRVNPDGARSRIADGEISVIEKAGRLEVSLKSREPEGKKPKTLWSEPKYSATSHGTKLLLDIFGTGLHFSYPKSVHLTTDAIRYWVDEHALVLDFFAGSGTTGHSVIKLNREDEGNRKYVLIEMGGYFDTVLKPRISKVVYSDGWKDGKPTSCDTGVSHCFKYIRLESYEDTLANIPPNLNRGPAQQSLLDSQSEEDQAAREAYLLNYMLDVETRGSDSLLNVKKFIDPTNYKLKVRNPSGDETKWVNVDLLETFNWLLGLTVEYIAAPIHFDAELKQAEYGRWQADVKRRDDGRWWFRTVTGTNRNGQKILIVWRNLPSLIAGEADGLVKDNAVLDAVLIDKLKVRLTESADDEFDILYVNGDHNITIPKKRNGELLEARVKLIEEDFHRLMFSTESH